MGGGDVCDPEGLAVAVRDACVEAALAAYERAGISGLCHEGRWECAVGAVRALDVAALVAVAGRRSEGTAGE